MSAIKIICRIEQGVFQQEMQSQATSEIQNCAAVFLQAFSPEALIRSLAEHTDENAVLVFRTSEKQMQSFCDVFIKNQN